MDQSDVQKDMYARWSTNNKVKLSYRAYCMNMYNNTCTDCKLLGAGGNILWHCP
jgi:hypothetical protein